jgi:hypothetical protein
VELDRQSIERRDFPIGRRGYEPAAVDSHLRALASEVEELRRSAESRAGESLGSAAGSRVQGILEAAETTAANIERQAAEDAGRVRAEADQDAQSTRADAVRRAQEHIAAVSQATAILLERVESMDGQVGELLESLRAGAGRLAIDLGSVESNMGELYDAASGRGASGSAVPVPAVPVPAAADHEAGAHDASGLAPLSAGREPHPGAAAGIPEREPSTEHVAPVAAGSAVGGATAGDLDGARLIALNMALNGEPREQADQYLAENFELPDRGKLLDEVYAAIEG